MTVTTLPFMDSVELTDSARAPGWFRIDCRLCDFHTFDGALHVCEDEAVDHLVAAHPRRLIGAHELDREVRLALNAHGYGSPQMERLLEQRRRRGM